MATGAVLRKGDGSSGTYTYSSQPRVVQQRGKYREPENRPSNIMYDKRIVRGNTYALHSLPASTQPNPLELQRQQESRRRVMARKRVSEHLRIRSPPPVDGRKHIDIQTELYLEEITDRVEEADVSTQTDAFLDRPPTPLFIPAKTGMDVATQIEDGDLFDFDLEVKPILEVLVGKTVEQALLEVMEEEELASLREQQRIFEENRNSELVETQRLEEQERRNREEKERRMKQQRQALLKEKETAEKVSARAFAQSYLSDLVPAVFARLSDGGFFYDPIEREIETGFMPWLMDETEKIVEKQVVARQLLDVILRELVKKKLGIMDAAPKVEETTEEVEGKKEDTPTEKIDEETKVENKEVSQDEPTKPSDDQSEKSPTEDGGSSSKEQSTTEAKPEEPVTKSEEPKTEELKPEEPVTEEQKPEEPVTEEPKSKEPEPKPEEPATEEPKPEEPVTEESKSKEQEPKPEETITEEPKPDKPVTEEQKPEEPVTEEPKPEEPVTEEPKPEEPVTEESKPESQEDQ